MLTMNEAAPANWAIKIKESAAQRFSTFDSTQHKILLIQN